MAIALTDLVADTRVQSGLRNNLLFSDAQIEALLTDAGNELYDILDESFEAYTVTQFSFTIAVGDSTVTLPVDFKRDNSLTKDPTLSYAQTVQPLGSWLERNQYLSSTWSNTQRRYFLLGAELQLFPVALAPGNYLLYYTPFFAFTGGADLPVNMTPWALYLTTHASIAIRSARQQDTSALDAKLQALKARAAKSVKNRTEAPRQAPITAHVHRHTRGHGWGW